LRWTGDGKFDSPVGVIVYTMPAISVKIRSQLFSDALDGLCRSEKMDFLNTNFRTISRVIVDPRLRGLGLAVKLVKESIPQIDVPVVESLAVMARVNRFFEKAGMTPVYPPEDERVLQMKEAFSVIGIKSMDLVDTVKLKKKIDKLAKSEKNFINSRIIQFIQAYGKRRDMPDGLAKIRYVLSKTGERPIYYYKIKGTGNEK
jgi:hypothetical protein